MFYMISCKFSEFPFELCRKRAFNRAKKALFWSRAKILPSGYHAQLDSCAGPFLGIVQKQKFLEIYSPLPSALHLHRPVCGPGYPYTVDRSGSISTRTVLKMDFLGKILKVCFSSSICHFSFFLRLCRTLVVGEKDHFSRESHDCTDNYCILCTVAAFLLSHRKRECASI